MIFQIFQLRNNIKEARANPGNFAGSQLRDFVIGIVIVPLIIIILGLGFLFALGFLHFLGGPYLFFKVVFFIGLFGSCILGMIIYKLTAVLRHAAKKVVNKTVEHVRNDVV